MKWTPEEDKFVMNSPLSNAELGKILGRSKNAVQKHKYKLMHRKTIEYDFSNKNFRRENVEELFNAVVVQAAMDYRIWSRRLKAKKFSQEFSKESLEKGIRGIERFFTSEYFSMFTDVDGTYILNRLKDEINTNEIVKSHKDCTNVL